MADGAREIRSVCVFCGSRDGRHETYRAAAGTIGHLIGARGLTLVYGGGGRGLMGAVADGALRAGGRVIGVIPSFLTEREAAHPGATEMRVVGSMAERKEVMIGLADAFVVLPGGVGTLDELFEVVSLHLLGMHEKPIGMLDVHDYFKPLREFTMLAQQELFVPTKVGGILIYEADPERLLERVIDGTRVGGPLARG